MPIKQEPHAPTSRSWSRHPLVDLLSTVFIVGACGVIIWRGIHPARSNSAPAVATTAPVLPSKPVSLAGLALKGGPDARVAIIEFSDFECRFCGIFARETLPTLDARYVSTGRVLFAFQHLPGPFHLNASNAAAAASCAGRQGRFWEMHDVLFGNQAAMQRGDIASSVSTLKLQPDAFGNCLDADGPTSVSSQAAAARQLGIAGTPTFFIGTVLPNYEVKVARRLTGARPLDEFVRALDEVLASTEASSSTQEPKPSR